MATRSTYRRRRTGLTMAEVSVATAIAGVMLVTSLDAVGTVFKTRRINATALTGPGLAQHLLEEIVALPYEDPQNPGGSIGVDSGESSASRATFDDVDDYNSFSSTDGRTKSGAAISGYTSWQCQAQVGWVQVAAPTTMSATESGLKRITVTVTSPSGVTSTAQALRSRYAALEQKPSVKIVAVNWLGVEFKAGSASRAEQWAQMLPNHADDPN